MITDRRDLRPMAATPHDLRPGMVLVEPEAATVLHVLERDGLVYADLSSGVAVPLGPGETVRILGESVHGRELATADVVWYEPSHRWAPLDVPAADAMRRYSPADPWVRAYVDPAWELEQARTPDRLSGCTCGGIGQTGAHTPECAWH